MPARRPSTSHRSAHGRHHAARRMALLLLSGLVLAEHARLLVRDEHMVILIDHGKAVRPHGPRPALREAAVDAVPRLQPVAPLGALSVPPDLLQAQRLQNENAGQVGPFLPTK